MVIVWSAITKSCIVAITSSFPLDEGYPECLSLSLDVHPSLLQWNQSITFSWLKASSWKAVLSFSSHLLEFCAKYDTHTSYCILRHHEYNTWQKHYCALAITASDWIAAVLQDIHENVQTCSKKIHRNATSGMREMKSVWMIFDQDSWHDPSFPFIIFSFQENT